MYFIFFFLNLQPITTSYTFFKMAKRILFLTAFIAMAVAANAENYLNMEPLKLDVPEMKPELVEIVETPLNYELNTMMPEPKMDFDFFKSKTNPGVKEYKFMDDMTFVGVPLFIAGWAIKGDKAMFRVNNKNGKKNTQLLTDFKTGIDDYTQFFGPAMVVGLKLGGVEGRSDWPRLLSSSLMSYAIMAGFVNGIKYTAKELRPDGSSRNSWPSGHTATSFVGATILHKEYGMTRSPWYSIAGYGVATATGVMRVLNNRHWVSDVMSGAGIGIVSTELGYALCDLMFKNRGLLRNDLDLNSDNPSFFSISMGVGLGGKDIGFNLLTDLQDAEQHGITQDVIDLFADNMDAADVNIDFRSATVVDAEGAYFFNKYVGVGGRFRVRAMSAKSFGNYADFSSEDGLDVWTYDINEIYENATTPRTLTTATIQNGGSPFTKLEGTVKSDHLAEFTGSLGLYFNLPLSNRFSLGTKLLIGRSFTQELDIDGHAEGYVKDINYNMSITNGKVTDLVIQDPTNTPDNETYTDDWDYLTLGAKSSTSYGTGLSLTYRHKGNFAFRLFVDYDYSKKTFTLMNDSYHYLKSGLTQVGYSLVSNPQVSQLVKDNSLVPFSVAEQLNPYYFKKDKKINFFTIGLSFMVNL